MPLLFFGSRTWTADEDSLNFFFASLAWKSTAERINCKVTFLQQRLEFKNQLKFFVSLKQQKWRFSFKLLFSVFFWWRFSSNFVLFSNEIETFVSFLVRWWKSENFKLPFLSSLAWREMAKSWKKIEATIYDFFADNECNRIRGSGKTRSGTSVACTRSPSSKPELKARAQSPSSKPELKPKLKSPSSKARAL